MYKKNYIASDGTWDDCDIFCLILPNNSVRHDLRDHHQRRVDNAAKWAEARNGAPNVIRAQATLEKYPFLTDEEIQVVKKRPIWRRDSETEAIYIEFSKKKATSKGILRDHIFADFDEDNNLIAVEIHPNATGRQVFRNA